VYITLDILNLILYRQNVTCKLQERNLTMDKQERDSGIVISDKLLYLCSHNQLNKIYAVSDSKYSELLHDMYESHYKVFDYPADCKKDSEKTYQRNKTQKTIALHINGKKASIAWIKLYCKFFGCSADYLLGIIESPLNETGLSLESISKLKRSDADTRELFSDMIESGYIKDVVSVMRSFYAIGNAININASNQENKKNYDKAIENIKLKMLRDSGADFIHKLAYDKKVFNHFMNNAVDIHQQQEKEFYKNMPAAFLENLEKSHQEQKESFLAIYYKYIAAQNKKS